MALFYFVSFRGSPVRVEVAIRAYAPCLSCATHAMGQMPLIVELEEAVGNTLDRRVRD